ncbi:MAG: DUF1919 domain-containing protein [Bacilli bacterium]|jgi:uncharacterized protein (DUF1919 family)
MNHKEIAKAAQNRYRILSKIFEKHYRKREFSRLKNRDFSIICSNCVAGLFYHSYNLPFLTPTINVDFNGEGFLLFACHLKEYLDMELLDNGRDVNGYIVAKLGEYTLTFPHNSTFEEAKDEWNRRKNRINHDNIVIMWNAKDKHVSKELIALFDQIGYRKFFFTIDEDLKNHPQAIFLKEYSDLESLPLLTYRINNRGERLYEKHFDWIGFLNGASFEESKK